MKCSAWNQVTVALEAGGKELKRGKIACLGSGARGDEVEADGAQVCREGGASDGLVELVGHPRGIVGSHEGLDLQAGISALQQTAPVQWYSS